MKLIMSCFREFMSEVVGVYVCVMLRGRLVWAYIVLPYES
jgi:hypothetical protein